ncbi:3-hydroxybutyryl-CoA dehydrogenase [Pseudomonas cremoricolorata]|uniref:3-hydroxybutyryl-CoA dehydrogenase n=1 Tax=Pseudomonas cremoricolorata TaxID=157783 RepID=UPI00048BE5DC|nr:3-hydroxybutyryl-CoA dehydrogenase [Pseudomonas cremoricolorata]
MSRAEVIAVAGAGRMGEGIALAFALAGHAVALLDLKPRDTQAQAALWQQARRSLAEQLSCLEAAQLLDAEQSRAVLERIEQVAYQHSGAALAASSVVFEAVPEVIQIKHQALGWISQHAPAEAIIASTTSTFLLSELMPMVSAPQRLLNAHWLNPAHLMPLVEISHDPLVDPALLQRFERLLQALGKVPVRCAIVPGYIVPRLQALVMNEAARMVAEGVASAQAIDTAVRTGLGLRFSVLGPLEFIDWGGNDTLVHASRYLTEHLGERFAAAPQVLSNAAHKRDGLRDGVGFYDYREQDISAYRAQRMQHFIERLRQGGLLPRIG